MADYTITTYEELYNEAVALDGSIHGTSKDDESVKKFVDRYIAQKGYRNVGNGIYISGKPSTAGKVLTHSIEIYNSEENGAKVLDGVLSVSTDQSHYVLTMEGVTVSAPYNDVMYSVISALGLSLNTTAGVRDKIDKMYCNIAKNLFGIELTPATLKDAYMFGIFKDGKTYIDSDIITLIANWLINNGYYDELVHITDNAPTTQGLWKIDYKDFSSAIITTAYHNMLKYGGSINFVLSAFDIENLAIQIANKMTQGNYNIVGIEIYNTKGYGSSDYDTLIVTVSLDKTEEYSNVSKGSVVFSVTDVLYIDNSLSRGENYFTSITRNGVGTLTLTSNPGIVYIYNGGKRDSNPSFSYSIGYASNLFISDAEYEHKDYAVPMENAVLPQPNIPLDIQYIDWNDKALPIGVPTDDDTIDNIKYYPVTFPYDNTQQIPNQTGDSNTTNIYNYYYNVNYTYPYNVIEGNTGNTPAVEKPTSSAGHNLYSIYNPTEQELADFGAFMFSDSLFDVLDNLKKLFENPIDSVISLQVCYFPTPKPAEPFYIYLGNINTGVQADVITNQYYELSLGYLDYPAKYGNVYDFEPYTTTQIYLPFIGIEHLNTADVLAGRLWITYRCDYLTGTCVADIEVERDGSKNLLYEFTGNLSVQIPVTGRNYSQSIGNFIGGMSNTIGNIVGSHTPNSAVGSAIGGMGSTFSSLVNSVNVQRSGNFSANAGAMCIKTPYLIITRNIPYQPSNYNMYYGAPANTEVKLGNCYGYTRVKSIHVLNIPKATKEEKTMIETILKEGVSILH